MVLLKLSMTLLLIKFIISSISYVNGECLFNYHSPSMAEKNQHALLTTAKMNFALNSLNKTASIAYKNNVFFSPHTIYEALTIAYIGAAGSTEESLRKTLEIPDDLSQAEIKKLYTSEFSTRQCSASSDNSPPSYEFLIANRLFISSSKKPRESISDMLGLQMENYDFLPHLESTRLHINDWVKNSTRGHIQDVIDVGGIWSGCDMIFVNAAYFKGLWQTSFNPDNSKTGIFYGLKNSNVTFMVQEARFNYKSSEYLEADILELPFDGEDISMFVFLPSLEVYDEDVQSEESSTSRLNNFCQDYGIKNVIERMVSEIGTAELDNIFADEMTRKMVKVSLPRFTSDEELPIRNVLASMGSPELVGAKLGDFSGFIDDFDEVYLSDVVHKSKIVVNEEGRTETIGNDDFSYWQQESINFTANRPFVYLIYDKNSHNILFNGIYRSS